MVLVIGGRAQGKLALTLARTGISAGEVCDGASCPLCPPTAAPVLNHLHLLIRRLLEEGRDPRALLDELLRANPGIIFISDEIGSGIVPIDPFEREWREVTGRICCELAQKSVRVERVFAGISTAIKGEQPCKSI